MKITMNELKRRVERAYAALAFCKLCPRECGVNRLKGEEGFCHTAKVAKVASHNVHKGEEPPISGVRGSGTIFFSSCNLRCKFCQNYPISQLGHGKEASPNELAKMMLWLQKEGCHNINLVTPSHVVPQFLAGLYIAKTTPLPKGESPLPKGERVKGEGGFNLPIVWNSSGYDGMESLKLLDGIIDVYMPDIKYSSNNSAEHYSSATNYWDIVRPVIKEMYRQVGELEVDKDGIATKGLIIRHLILPNDISGTEEVLKFISHEISLKTHISLMSQYFPADRSLKDENINRRLTTEEYANATELLDKYGLENGWTQPY
jgi:putative pyruvate formate lyase activating enzyme